MVGDHVGCKASRAGACGSNNAPTLTTDADRHVYSYLRGNMPVEGIAGLSSHGPLPSARKQVPAELKEAPGKEHDPTHGESCP